MARNSALVPEDVDQIERERERQEKLREDKAYETAGREADSETSEADQKAEAERRMRAFELSPALREAEATRIQKEVKQEAKKKQEAEEATKAKEEKEELTPEQAQAEAILKHLAERVSAMQLRPEETRKLNESFDQLRALFKGEEPPAPAPADNSQISRGVG